jgi:hypothetical protein
VLGKLFRPKKNEVSQQFKISHPWSFVICTGCSIVRRVKSRREETRNAFRILVGKSLVKRSLGSSRRWEDKIKMNIWG